MTDTCMQNKIKGTVNFLLNSFKLNRFWEGIGVPLELLHLHHELLQIRFDSLVHVPHLS